MAEKELFGNSEQLESCVHEKDHVAAPGKKVGDLISRAGAIETVRKAKSIGQAHRMLVQLPSAQPSATDTNVATTDTISRQAVLRILNRNMSNGFYDYNHDWWDPTIDMEAINEIKVLPSAQRKGHGIDEGTNYACSKCHRGCWVNSNYCPWCGADMRGEDDE